MRTFYPFKTFIILFFFCFNLLGQEQTLVHTLDEFNQAVKEVRPGSTIVLANGVWKDAELLLEGKGTSKAPITLTVEDKGKVT